MTDPANNINSPGAAQVRSRPEGAPQFGGVRLGQSLTAGLYLLLVASAFLTFFGRRFPGRLPHFIEQVVPWMFLAFVGIFAFYRLGLVQARKYPAFKAFFQIGLMVVVWLLLFPSSRPGSASREETLEALMTNMDPRVRALAAEVARTRPEPQRYGPSLVRALEDADGRVREEAHQSLVRITGRDLGEPEDASALRAWKERYP